MKRAKHLWEEIVAFENIHRAAHQAMKGKRWKSSVMDFAFDLERHLINIQHDLKTQRYAFGAYKSFEIFEPKRRLISAAPLRDRVIHHALCNVIEPVFDPTFVSSYANRKQYGTHRALKAFSTMYYSTAYVLKCDIRKYFPSIDHAVLKTLIRRKIGCAETLSLIDSIIDHSNPQEPMNDYFPGDTLFTPFERRRGIPIGNLTSQFFANIYLDPLDHFVKETLRCRKYVRYVDDFVLFHESQSQLEAWRTDIETFLESYRLRIHPIKSQITATTHGVNFLGFRFMPGTVRVRNENKRRGMRRLRKQRIAVAEGTLKPEKASASLESWFAHLSFGNTSQLRKRIIERTTSRSPQADGIPQRGSIRGGSWNNNDNNCRISNRNDNNPENRNNNNGFRPLQHSPTQSLCK